MIKMYCIHLIYLQIHPVSSYPLFRLYPAPFSDSTRRSFHLETTCNRRGINKRFTRTQTHIRSHIRIPIRTQTPLSESR